MIKLENPLRENNGMDEDNIKKISISAKRQMTIPKKFYDELQMENEVLCQVVDGALMIKPVRQEIDFSEEILGDLIKEGYEAGEELIKEFAYRKSQINNALHKMIEDTRNYKSYTNANEYFNTLDNEVENE